MAPQTPGADFVCDCGHLSRFCASTVFEAENESRRCRKPLILIDTEPGVEEHRIEFHKGAAVAILCPERGRCLITWDRDDKAG